METQAQAQNGTAQNLRLAKDLAREVAQAIETEANVKAVFGEPRKLDNCTIIPVASVHVSLGAGGGMARSTGLAKQVQGAVELAAKVLPTSWGGGLGGGLQVHVKPVGFIREGKEGATFSPIPTGATAES